MAERKKTLMQSAIILSIILPIIIGIIYIYRYGVNVPYWDQWDFEPVLIKRLYDGNLVFANFFMQHNESRPFFPRIIMLIAALMTRYNTVSEMFLMYLFYCLSFALVFLMYKKENGINEASLLAFAPISWFYFNLFQMSNMLFGVRICQAMMLFGFLGAVFCINSSKEPDKWFASSIVAAIISSFSFDAGLTVWPVCLLQIVLQDSKYKLRKAIIWTFTGGVVFSAYLHMYSKPPGTPSLLYFLQNPLQAAIFFLASFGMPIIRVGYLTPIVGALMIIIAILVILNGNRLRDKKILNQNIKWISLILFSIIVSAELTVGRSGNGVLYALSQRYYLIAFLSVVGLYCILLNFLRSNDIENRNSKGEIIKVHLNYVLFGTVATLIFIAIIAQSIDGISEGAMSKNDRLMMEYYLKTYEIQSDNTLKLLYPNAKKIRAEAPFLKKYHLSVFAESDREIRSDILPELKMRTLYSVDAINKEDLNKRKNVTYSTDKDKISIEGWAIDESMGRPAKAVFITIDDKINIPTMYGLEREDVANAYKNKNYKYSGFKASFTPNILQNGSHNLLVKIESEKGYYKANPNITLIIKNSEIYAALKE